MNLSNFAECVRRSLASVANSLGNHPVLTGAAVASLAILVLLLDFASSPYVELSIVYVILIAAGTQFTGWQFGLALASFLPASHFMLYLLVGNSMFPLSIELFNIGLLFFAGVATVYLLRLAHHLEELRQANLRLETLQQTMVTVNDIVLNRLQVMQFVIHLAEQGRPLSPEQIKLGREALDEMAVKLSHLSQLSQYETTEVTSGVHAVRVPEAIAHGDPA